MVSQVVDYTIILHCLVGGEYRRKAFRSRQLAEEYEREIQEQGGFCRWETRVR